MLHDPGVLKSVRTIADLEKAFSSNRTWVDRSSDRIAAFAGSAAFVAIHAIFFAVWVIWNTRSRQPADPYPFTFLTFIVSLEAIFLTSFVLISQNHSERQQRHRAALDLQINLLAEREMTKVLSALTVIAKRLDVDACDPEALSLAQETDIAALASAVAAAESDPDGEES